MPSSSAAAATKNEPTIDAVVSKSDKSKQQLAIAKEDRVYTDFGTDCNRTPEQDDAGWWTWAFFNWVTPVLERGTERAEALEPLLADDLLKLPQHELPKDNYDRIIVLWEEEVQKRDGPGGDPDYEPNITNVLWDVYKGRIMFGGVCRFLSDGCAYAMPWILREFLMWLKDPMSDDSLGWMWLIVLVITNWLMGTFLQWAMHHTATGFYQMRGAIRILVFESCLRFPASHEETGKILAAHSSDTQALQNLAFMVHGIWIGPIILCASVIALWFFIGRAGICVFAIMIATAPLQGIFMGKIFGLRPDLMKAGAQRINSLNEVLSGIRIVKFMCWEKAFAQRISDKREEELEFFTSMAKWRVPLMVTSFGLPMIINFCAFALQVAFDGKIDTATAFPAISVLNMTRIPLIFIPMGIASLLDTKLSMKRISEVCSFRDRYDFVKKTFAAAAAAAPPATTTTTNEGDVAATSSSSEFSIEVDNITVLGSEGKDKKKEGGGAPAAAAAAAAAADAKKKEEANNNNNNGEKKNGGGDEEMKDKKPDSGASAAAATTAADEKKKKKVQVIAKNLSVSIPRGKLTIVVGCTSSGKSTLVKALVGECEVVRNQGSVTHHEPIAYVPQEAWIMNATVRDNIVMSEPYDAQKYDSVVAACQLSSDFDTMPAHDRTEIGAQGINISGGQKQRLSIARAAYSGRDCIIFDDPLSAVDPHVSVGLFDECINGLLAGKTRVLVTHQTHLVPRADFIIMMKDCAIRFAGTVAEMRAAGLLEELTKAEEEEAATKKKADAAKSKAAVALLKSSPITPVALTTAAGAAPVASPARAPAEGRLIVAEEDKIGGVDWSAYGWYFSLGGSWLFAGVNFFGALASGCFIIGSLVLALWTTGDRTPPGIPNGTFTQQDYMLWMGVFSAGGTFLVVFRQLCFAIFAVNVARNCHNAAMENVLRAPTSFFDTTPMGRILNRFQKDVTTIDFAVAENLTMVINMAFIALGALIQVFVGAPYILVIMPFLIGYFVHIFNFYSKTARGVKRLDGSTQSPVMAILNETVSGLASIRVYGIGEKLNQEHMQRTTAAHVPYYNVRNLQRWLAVRSDMTANFVLFLTILFGVIARQGDMTKWLPLSPELIALAITSVIQVTNTVSLLNRTLAELETEMASTERLKEYSDQLPQELVYEYDSDELEANELGMPDPSRKTGRKTLSAPGPDWPRSNPTVEFDRVNMRYRPGLPLVLKNVSFKIPAGARVGLVGRSGSGKSSILQVLFRMVEIEGGVISIGGRNTRQASLFDVRSAVCIIPQDPTLYSGTVRYNITGPNAVDDERIWKAIDKLMLRHRLTDFITAKDEPKGLDALVREKGSNFSLGERQKLCLVRAMMKQASILALDESSASLDQESDAIVQRVIREEFPRCTTITIAHRLATIIDSDIIIAMKDGEVAEMGKPSELLKQPGSLFYGMVAKLGPEQFEILRQIASGEKSYMESLHIDTTYEDK